MVKYAVAQIAPNGVPKSSNLSRSIDQNLYGVSTRLGPWAKLATVIKAPDVALRVKLWNSIYPGGSVSGPTQVAADAIRFKCIA